MAVGVHMAVQVRSGPWSTGNSGHARAVVTTNATGSPWVTSCGQTSFGPARQRCRGVGKVDALLDF